MSSPLKCTLNGSAVHRKCSHNLALLTLFLVAVDHFIHSQLFASPPVELFTPLLEIHNDELLFIHCVLTAEISVSSSATHRKCAYHFSYASPTHC